MSKRIWLSLFLLIVSFVSVLSLVAGMQPDGAVPAAISRDFETAVHNDIAAAECASPTLASASLRPAGPAPQLADKRTF